MRHPQLHFHLAANERAVIKRAKPPEKWVSIVVVAKDVYGCQEALDITFYCADLEHQAQILDDLGFGMKEIAE